MLADQLGQLGSKEEEPGMRLFASCQNNYSLMTSDPVTLQLGSDCMSRIHDQFRFQLVEMWFNVHPLSMVISKTLFLRSYKDGQHDEALLAVIMAGAQHSYRVGKFADTELQLFEYAEALLSDRSDQDWDLTTAQVVLLLGWHELCVRRTHKAAYLIAYAGRIAAELQQGMTTSTSVPKGRANGVDIDSIEEEIVRNIYWITFAMTLWAFMEMGEPFAALLPRRLPPAFPAVDETHSAIIELDMASDNVSTFQSQVRNIRGLWPLAHIASTIGHIYALYPRDGRSHRDTPVDIPWQFRPLHQLRGLLRLNDDRDTLSQSVRRVLKDAVEGVEKEVQNDVSKALVSAAYLVLVIHLEFPKNDDEDQCGPEITPQRMERFYRAAAALAQIITRVVASRTSTWLLFNTPVSSTTAMPLVDTFSSGLDIVGRTTAYLLSTAQSGNESQLQAILPYLSRLGDLAHCLYLAAKEDPLRLSRKSRTAKKLLKVTCLRASELGVQLGMITKPKPEPGKSWSSSPVAGLSDFDPYIEPSSTSITNHVTASGQPSSSAVGEMELEISNSTGPGSGATASVTANMIAGDHFAQPFSHAAMATLHATLDTAQDIHLMDVVQASQAQLDDLNTDLVPSDFWDLPLQEQHTKTIQDLDISIGMGGYLPTSNFFSDAYAM